MAGPGPAPSNGREYEWFGQGRFGQGKLDKVIEISYRAVADYGFQQAVLYGSQDVARRWDLGNRARATLEEMVLAMLAALPIPGEPENIPGEQARLADPIRTATRG